MTIRIRNPYLLAQFLVATGYVLGTQRFFQLDDQSSAHGAHNADTVVHQLAAIGQQRLLDNENTLRSGEKLYYHIGMNKIICI